MRIAVIGAGAYGSYSVAAIQQKFSDAEITVFDVGSENIKSEDEIGYKSHLYGDKYTGLENGRYFGFGGATARWGGQLLMFSEEDFSDPSPLMRDIIKVDHQYKNQVFRKFGISPDDNEPYVTSGLFIKTGVWLGYFRRNLFKHFKIAKRRNVNIITKARILRVFCDAESAIAGFEYFHEGSVHEARGFSYYFLTAGAFESVRILLSSGLLQKKKVPFSDHLSQKVFKIKGDTRIGRNDFSFGVKGTSLITKRLIGEIEGVSFFANPIYNAEFPFFQNLKKLLFQGDRSLKTVFALAMDILSCLAFFWSAFVRKKIFVYNNEWDFYIDIENPDDQSHVSLSSDLDSYGVPALDVEFHIGKKASMIYNKAKEELRKYLVDNDVTFFEYEEKIQVDKCEDTYHPYGMFTDFASLDALFMNFKNMLVVNTGVLPRAGGINTTAALFPVIEEYVARMNKR